MNTNEIMAMGDHRDGRLFAEREREESLREHQHEARQERVEEHARHICTDMQLLDEAHLDRVSDPKGIREWHGVMANIMDKTKSPEAVCAEVRAFYTECARQTAEEIIE